MRVLIFANMYPNIDNPVNGIFIKEQLDSFKIHYPMHDVDVLPITEGGAISKYITSAFKLFKKLTVYKPDIIHVHFGLSFLPLFLLLPYIKFKRIKLVTTFHGSDVLGKNRLTKLVSALAAKYSDALISVSKQIQNKLDNKNRTNHYLPCGVSEEFIELSKATQDERSNKIIFPSTPTRPEKNYPLFERLTAKLYCELGADNFECVSMHGLSRKEVVNLFKTSKCLVLTSLYEGSPQVIKEAIVCDLPIVSTPVGDVPHLLKNERLSVVSENELELLNGIRKFLIEKSPILNFNETTKLSVGNDLVSSRLNGIYTQLLDTIG